ncbi:hypothetical protein HDV00_006670 [Rhizophlyctis rosea]|nr:hypothetical protein HDV00_006670 [Rhizophlyctis rosea]
MEQTLLHASELGFSDVVVFMLSKGVDPDVRGQGIHETGLTYASIHGYTDIVKLLLSAGANPAAHRGVALSMAISHGRLDIVDLFVQTGADVNGKVVSIPAHFVRHGSHVRTEDWTNLICGVRGGNLGIVRLLLNAGADVTYRHSRALLIAVRMGRVDLARVLLHWGANIDGDEGRRPIVEAAYDGDIALVRFLLEEGADGRVDDDDALLEACRHNHNDVAALLLSHGADVHCQDGACLVGAAKQGYLQVVWTLMKAGADPNAQAGRALSKTVKAGHYHVALYLLGEGAKLRIRTALIYAATSRRSDLVNILLTHLQNNIQVLADVWGRKFIRDPAYSDISSEFLEEGLIPVAWPRVIMSLATCGEPHAAKCLRQLLWNIGRAERRDGKYWGVVQRAAEEAARLGHGRVVNVMIRASEGRIGIEKVGELQALMLARVLPRWEAVEG